LRENELTFEFVEILKWVIRELPLSRIDLRGNAGISDTVVAAIRRDMEDEEIRETRFGSSRRKMRNSGRWRCGSAKERQSSWRPGRRLSDQRRLTSFTISVDGRGNFPLIVKTH
jgi:hypothetical protein